MRLCKCSLLMSPIKSVISTPHPFHTRTVAHFSTSSLAQQLKDYEGYLHKHNQHIKKPHIKLQTQQQRIVKQCLRQQQYSDLIDFLLNNTDKALCHQDTSKSVDEHLSNIWQQLDQQDQLKATMTLACFRERKTFTSVGRVLEEKFKERGERSLNKNQLIVYLYGTIINDKNINKIVSLYPLKDLSPKQVLENLLNSIKFSPQKSLFQIPTILLSQYLGLLINPSLNKKEELPLTQSQSRLEQDVQTFLQIIDCTYRRQVRVNSQLVDLIVNKRQGRKEQTYLLQVNGSYHYTLAGKLKGREIVRAAIVSQYAPLRIVHHVDYMKSKGHRNKMAYLQSLFEAKEVNWEARNKGFNSNWHVKMDQETLDKVKQSSKVAQ